MTILRDPGGRVHRRTLPDKMKGAILTCLVEGRSAGSRRVGNGATMTGKDLVHLLYSFTGRISRLGFWMGLVIIFSMLFVLWSFGDLLVLLPSVPEHLRFPLAFLFFGATVLLPILALVVKRLHDRDKPAWWLLPFSFMPYWMDKLSDRLPEDTPAWWAAVTIGFVLGMWGLIEFGFLKGTAGPNGYGPDPLAGPGSSPD